ncbi:MAG: acyltransferase [Gemmatimonadetes bacterium]|nr:acyltransferase [Gemmatimonadota bacterium]
MATAARVVSRLRESPTSALAAIIALARGWLTVRWYRLRGFRVRAGRNFRIFGQLKLSGPGEVIFGDDVRIDMLVTPFTHHPDARIEIGNNCFLNGTRFGCFQSIQVGDNGILAQAMLMDTNFHSTGADRHNPEAPVKVAPISLAENVWVAAQAGLLPGTRVGRNSVVGFGAVCSGEFPANVIIAGKPGHGRTSHPGAPEDTA